MGFYNGLANNKKSFLQFDHVYSNRAAMEGALTTDKGPSEVTVGGYALVQYWNEDRNLIPAFQLDKASPYLSADQEGKHFFLVAIEDVESTSISEETSINEGASTNENETESQETDTETNPTDNKDNKELAEDDKIYIINKNSYFIATNRAGEEVGYFSCDQSGYTADTDLYATGYYKARFKLENAAADREGTEKDNYIWNYKVDMDQYPGAGRGWNGTVWQKVASAGGAKYQFIADLNSATPTFDVVYEAPTKTPLVPHFDADISNIYYKIHMQPQWGIRIREASPTPENTTESDLYPSDISGEFVKFTRKENGEVQQELVDSTPLAIYYNKEGFNKNKSSSKPEVDDFIKFTPTGISGNLYYNNDSTINPTTAVDTYELSMMLPSIGQTISDVWDIVYGGNVERDNEGNVILSETVNETDVIVPQRNTHIEWNDYAGERAFPTSRSASLTYKPEALNTIAGNINTFHDITGMIIREFSQENFDPSKYDVSNWDPTKIYYNNKDNKFYIKVKTYSYAAGSDYWERPNIKVSNNEEITTRYLDVVSITDAFKEDLKQHPTKGWYYDYLKLTDEKDYVDGAVYVQIASLPNGYYKKNNNYLKDLSIEDGQGGYSRPTLTQVEIWRPNTFYTRTAGDNEDFIYTLSTSYDSNAVYYKKIGPYVITEGNIFKEGTEWDFDFGAVPSGATLGIRKEKWVAKELPGLNFDHNNILSFLIKLNQLLNDDDNIRDFSTIPGIQNKISDFLKQFKSSADNITEHFWYSSEEGGAIVTQKIQSGKEGFLNSPSNMNLLLKEKEVEIRDGETPYLSIDLNEDEENKKSVIFNKDLLIDGGVINADALNLSFIDVEIDSAGWSSEVTEVNVDSQMTRSFYIYSIENLNILANIPEISLIPENEIYIIPTLEQENAFNNIDYITADIDEGKLKLYSGFVPTENFKIRIFGVKNIEQEGQE